MPPSSCFVSDFSIAPYQNCILLHLCVSVVQLVINVALSSRLVISKIQSKT